MKRPRTTASTVVVILAALAIFAIERSGLLSGRSGTPTPAPTRDATGPAAPTALPDGAEAIVAAFRAGASDLVVEAGGTVDRVLADDTDGSPHQRFVVRLAGGHTVLVANNIDLAPRVPVREGDAVSFRGEYEWNDRGGVIHWTHHDPQARREGGWIEHDGRRYR